MNLLQCAPLCDSQGRVKYFIGAQIDVSGLALDGAQMESLIELQSRYRDPDEESIAEMPEPKPKDEFRELCELFSPRELVSVQENGGDLFQPLNTRASSRINQRAWLQRGNSLDSEAEAIRLRDLKSPLLRGSLTGVYENVSYVFLLSSLLPAGAEANATIVPPRSALSLPPCPVHIALPPDSRDATVLVLFPHWQLLRRERRATSSHDARAQRHGTDQMGDPVQHRRPQPLGTLHAALRIQWASRRVDGRRRG